MISAFGVDHGEIEKGLFGGGAHGARQLPKIFGRQTGGARKAIKPVGGARKAGARKGTATTNEPLYAQMAQKYGINQGGARKAGARRAF